MTKTEILIETSYILGMKNKEFEKAIDDLGFELLIENYSLFLESLYNEFGEWQKDKDDSTLNLLHEFIEIVLRDLTKYIEMYW